MRRPHQHSVFLQEQARSKRLQAIAEWSRNSTAPENQPGENHILPFGATNLPFRLVQMVPPGSEIARRVLGNSGKKSGIRGALRKSWEARHTPITHDKLPKCQPPPKRHTQESKCYQAGRCLCDGRGRFDNPVAEAFCHGLISILRKPKKQPKTLARKLYDQREFFVRISSDSGQRAYWHHVGHGNLSSQAFTLAPLSQLGPIENGTALMEGRAAASNAHIALADLSRSDSWSMECWMPWKSRSLVPHAFRAGRFRLQRIDVPTAVFWRNGLLALPPIPADWGSDEEEGGEEQSSDSGSGDDSGDGGDDGPAGGARALKRLQRLCQRHSVQAAWQPLSESDDDGGGREGSGGDGGGSGVREGRGGDSAEGGPEARDPAAPPVPPCTRGRRSSAAAPGERVDKWGPFKLSRVMRDGVQIGWGIVCGRHSNATNRRACKKQLPFGFPHPFTEREVLTLLKQWVLKGYEIDPSEPQGQHQHVHGVEIHDFDAQALDEDLDAQLVACVQMEEWENEAALSEADLD